MLKKDITCFVSPCSKIDKGGTDPAEEFIGVGMFRYVTVVSHFFLNVLAVFESALILVAFRLGEHLLWRLILILYILDILYETRSQILPTLLP